MSAGCASPASPAATSGAWNAPARPLRARRCSTARRRCSCYNSSWAGEARSQVPSPYAPPPAPRARESSARPVRRRGLVSGLDRPAAARPHGGAGDCLPQPGRRAGALGADGRGHPSVRAGRLCPPQLYYNCPCLPQIAPACPNVAHPRCIVARSRGRARVTPKSLLLGLLTRSAPHGRPMASVATT